MARWVEGQVIDTQRWTEQLYSLRFDAPVEPFSAGQFTKVALDIDSDRIGRPYSYVNAPSERPLEIYFIRVPNGPLTNRLIELEPGRYRVVIGEAGAGWTGGGFAPSPTVCPTGSSNMPTSRR